jgi:hypothetical protein
MFIVTFLIGAAEQIMEGGKYSILLGKFDKYRVLPARPGDSADGDQISVVDVKVTPPPGRGLHPQIRSARPTHPITPQGALCSCPWQKNEKTSP